MHLISRFRNVDVCALLLIWFNLNTDYIFGILMANQYVVHCERTKIGSAPRQKHRIGQKYLQNRSTRAQRYLKHSFFFFKPFRNGRMKCALYLDFASHSQYNHSFHFFNLIFSTHNPSSFGISQFSIPLHFSRPSSMYAKRTPLRNLSLNFVEKSFTEREYFS